MDSAHNYRATKGMKMKELNRAEMELNSDTLLIIKLPDSRVLRIMSRSLFLAIILLALPYIGSFMGGSNSELVRGHSNAEFDPSNLKMLPALFRDFVKEGIVRRGHKGLLLGCIGDVAKDLEFLNDNYGVHLVTQSDLGYKDLITDYTFDFVFGFSFKSFKSVDSFLKTDGVAITQLNIEPLDLQQTHPNYRIVYLRRFESTIVAMRKASSVTHDGLPNSSKKSKLCRNKLEARQAALRGLEDALLEPPPKGPRRELLKLNNGPRKIKFLPDLIGVSLEDYPRRFFISDEKNGVEEWFYKNYPSKKQHFEVYDFEVNKLASDQGLSGVRKLGISNWLRNNARADDFVVMKAEAEVAEEMMKEKTICLVDELFLGCKNQWQDEANQRAYWQCLALYGDLRDQGVAVHQWWN